MEPQRRRIWQNFEIKSLLNSWKHHVNKISPGKKRFTRKSLYSEISKDLCEKGYNRLEHEVMFKIVNLIRYHRRTKQLGQVDGPLVSKWFDQVEEIVNLEMKLQDAQNIIEEVPEPNKHLLVRTNITNDEKGSESNLLSYTIVNSAESEVPNNSQLFQVILPELSSSNFQSRTDNIMQKFCRELKRSNRELEKNDIAILELFKQQNEIFRKQTKLLFQLLKND